MAIQGGGGALTPGTLAAIGTPQYTNTDTLTAHAGGLQANALALPSTINRATVVTTLADSFVLPPGVAGSMVVLVNSGANACQVYGAGTDTINDVATATGVSQMANSVEVYFCTSSSAAAAKWYVEIGTGFSAGLVTDTVQDGIIANVAAAQVGATQLTCTINRVATVASAGNSVMLPPSAAGLDIIVINHGANAMGVYGAGTDTIDDQATATGVSQMANSVVIYMCATGGVAGKWYSEGLATGFGGPGLQTLSFAPAITAHNGGTQALAFQLTGMINRVSVAANQGDSVQLPTAVVGLAITVINRGANPIQVFGNNTAADTINAIATATGISQGIATSAVYVCNVAGNWEVPLSSLVSSTPALLAGDGAIPAHVQHTYVITKGSAAALTLAAPTATTDDGIEITITSNTAFLHAITATGLLQTGSANHNVATWAAQTGGSLVLMAYQAKWNVISQIGITFT